MNVVGRLLTNLVTNIMVLCTKNTLSYSKDRLNAGLQETHVYSLAYTHVYEKNIKLYVSKRNRT